MVDSSIKQVTIKKASLPPIDSTVVGYIFKYRIISEDKNRTSQWSPINLVLDDSIVTVNGVLQVSEKIIVAVWGDEANRPKYDIFVGFDNEDLEYHGTSPTHSYSFINLGETNVRVVVQVESSTKEINDDLKIYDSGLESLV